MLAPTCFRRRGGEFPQRPAISDEAMRSETGLLHRSGMEKTEVRAMITYLREREPALGSFGLTRHKAASVAPVRLHKRRVHPRAVGHGSRQKPRCRGNPSR